MTQNIKLSEIVEEAKSELDATEVYSSELAGNFFDMLGHKKHGVTELCAIFPNKKILIGFFNNRDAFVKECEKFAGRANLYSGVNPREPHMLEFSANKLQKINRRAKAEDISSLMWIPIDIDPKRLKDTSATDEEKAKAFEVASKIVADLGAKGYQTPFWQDSGNGAQLFLAIPPVCLNGNHEEIQSKIKQFEAGIRKQYQSSEVEIDSVHDLPRIMKVSGTLAIKGESSKERPHRLAQPVSGFERNEDKKLWKHIEQISCEPQQALEPVKLAKLESGLPQAFTELLETDSKVQTMWEDCLQTPVGSRSEKALGLANVLVKKITPQETAQVISHWYQQSGKPATKSFLETTISKSLVSVPPYIKTSDKKCSQFKGPVFERVSAFLSRPETKTKWLVQNYIPQNWPVIFAGKSKAGKSLFSMDLAKSVATGDLFLGQPTKKGPVCILALDDPPSLVQNRIREFGFTDEMDVYVSTTRFCDGFLDQLSEELSEIKPVLLIVDTLVKTIPKQMGAENDASVMDEVLERFAKIAEGCGSPTMVFIHHFNKGHELRGSTAIEGAAPLVIKAHRKASGLVEIEFETKLEPVAPIFVEFDSLKCEFIFLGEKEEFERQQLADKIAAYLDEEPEASTTEIAKACETRREKVEAFLEGSKEYESKQEKIGIGRPKKVWFCAETENNKHPL